MLIRDLKIVKQTNRANGIFITLFELVLWNKKTRYHATVHCEEITKKHFDDLYYASDYVYCTLKVAEAKYETMTKSDVEINPVKIETNDKQRKEVFPRGYVAADKPV